MKRRTLRMIEDRCSCGHPLTPKHLKELHRGIKNRDETITKRNRMIRQMERDVKAELKKQIKREALDLLKEGEAK